MKKIFLLLLFFNAAFAISQWSHISTIPGSANINCISVVNQNLIWVSGDNRSVYRSTNGGINWVAKNNGLPAGNITSVSAIDSLSCWIGTESGSIYKTSNGGVNWTMQFSLAGSFSDGIKMFDQNFGVYYADPTGAGQPHQWRYTTNGGSNWLLSPNAPVALANEAGLLNAWDWIDTGKFWISTGNFTPNITSARTFRSSNGFAGNWIETTLTGTGNADGLYFSAIAFTDSTRGMTASNGSGSAMRKTTDGGATWTVIANPPGASNYIPFNMCGIKDGSNTIFAFLYTTTSLCFKTTDFGTTWTQESLPTAVYLRQGQFLSPTLGFAGGGSGVFLRYGNPIGITLTNTEIPSAYYLGQNYPNPFNPKTIINYKLPGTNIVSLKVFDVLGNEVATLVNEKQTAGSYSVDFYGNNLSSGIYFYNLRTEEFSETKQMMFIK